MKNTSQDPEYVGAVGHEKKFHQTHFGVTRTLRKTKKEGKLFRWVLVAPGKYKLVKKVNYERNE
jgi:hypothetical protein